MREITPPKDEFSFFLLQPAAFIFTALPVRKAKGAAFVKECGQAKITIHAGYDPYTKEHKPIPYGTRARLITMWLAQQVKAKENAKQKAPIIRLNGSYNEFLVSLGFNRQGRAWKEMQAALANYLDSKITYSYNSPGYQFKEAALVADKYALWENGEGGFIHISEKFAKILRAGSIPVNLEVIKAIKNNAMALDVYPALCRMAYHAKKQRKAQTITVRRLKERYCGGNDDFKSYKKRLACCINELSYAFPGYVLGIRPGDAGKQKKDSDRYPTVVISYIGE